MDELLKRIIFLSYLTNYNIPTIYRCLGTDIKRPATLSYGDLAMLAIGGKNVPVEKLSTLSKDVDKAKENTNQAIDRLKYLNITPITFIDKNYPVLLHDLNDKPPVIYVRGKLSNKRKLAAIVGSRTISSGAVKITDNIVDRLSEYGFDIVSGLALGIDTLAHKRALYRGDDTVAVLPVSLDKIYPSENYRLASDILEKGGAVISEMIFGINKGKSSFVQRNRLQSGLAKMVIPIEMGITSGTMHTIDFTMRQKRDLILLKRKTSITEYEGVKYLIDKYSKNPADNVHIINGINNFVQYLTSKHGAGSIGVQMQMF
jgi:DNA processing protein